MGHVVIVAHLECVSTLFETTNRLELFSCDLQSQAQPLYQIVIMVDGNRESSVLRDFHGYEPCVTSLNHHGGGLVGIPVWADQSMYLLGHP
jgi:hypothetical protein